METTNPDVHTLYGDGPGSCPTLFPNTFVQFFSATIFPTLLQNSCLQQLRPTLFSNISLTRFFQQFYNCNTLLQRSSTTFPCITTLKEFVSNTLQHCAPTTSHPTLFLNTSLHDSSVQPSSPTLLSTPFKNCFFQHSSPTLLHNARYQALDFFLHILFQAHPNHFPTVQRLVCIISNIINIQNSQLGLPDYPVPAAKTSGR